MLLDHKFFGLFFSYMAKYHIFSPSQTQTKKISCENPCSCGVLRCNCASLYQEIFAPQRHRDPSLGILAKDCKSHPFGFCCWLFSLMLVQQHEIYIMHMHLYIFFMFSSFNSFYSFRSFSSFSSFSSFTPLFHSQPKNAAQKASLSRLCCNTLSH